MRKTHGKNETYAVAFAVSMARLSDKVLAGEEVKVHVPFLKRRVRVKLDEDKALTIGEVEDKVEAEIRKSVDCDFCKEKGKKLAAVYDGKTIYGPWAYMCEEHFKAKGAGLGLGIGQRLIVRRQG